MGVEGRRGYIFISILDFIYSFIQINQSGCFDLSTELAPFFHFLFFFSSFVPVSDGLRGCEYGDEDGDVTN